MCCALRTSVMTSLNLAELRQQLIESGTYLADPQLLDHVHWVPDGRRNVLVYNDELLGNDDADGGHVSGPAILLAVLSFTISILSPQTSSLHLQS